MSDEETKHGHTREPTPSLPFDFKEFNQLDKKIKAGEATNDEEASFAKLAPKMAKFQVKDYEHRTPEDEKKLLEEHRAKFDPKNEGAINTVAEYIEETMDNYQLEVEYLWTIFDHRREEQNLEKD